MTIGTGNDSDNSGMKRLNLVAKLLVIAACGLIGLAILIAILSFSMIRFQ